MTLSPGEYYPRIYRGVRTPWTLDHSKAYFSFGESFHMLFEMLEDLFRVVEPVDTNNEAYGQKFRHLLMLLCTEVEAAWVGVLKANGYLKERYSTNDYVKLLPAMRLNEYCFHLWRFKDYSGPIMPFGQWNNEAPTQSLAWYDAYNAAKHNREENLDKATLGNVILAAAALLAMGAAQFGTRRLRGLKPGYYDQKVFLWVGEEPSWTQEELYAESDDEQDSIAKNFSF